MNKFKKIIASAILIIFVSQILPVIPFGINHAKAAIPVFETNAALLADSKVTSIANTESFLQNLYEWAQTFVLSTLKKRLLDMLVDQIIQWIQGGGKPQFVSDWGGFLQDAGNIAAGDFAEQIGAGFLCQPFNLRIQFDLRFKRFSQIITCTLDDIVGNIENFYEDFRNGGWIGYTASIEPQNNYFGARLIAEAENDKRIYNAQEAAQNEALSGGGFLSTKKCNENPNSNGPDIDGDGKRGDISSTCTITTPGTTIGNLVSKAVGSDIDFIIGSEQLGDYVSAIADAAINRLIIEGVEGLQGLTTKNAPGGGAISPVRGACRGLTGAVLDACRRYTLSSGNSFSAAKANIITQINQTFVPREQSQPIITDSIIQLQNYLPRLQNLKNQFEKFSLTTCPLRDINITEINVEMAWASSTIPLLITEKSDNQTFLDKLQAEKNNIKTLPQEDWTAFSILTHRVQTSGLLDASGAVVFKSGVEAKNQEIKDRIKASINKFTGELNKC